MLEVLKFMLPVEQGRQAGGLHMRRKGGYGCPQPVALSKYDLKKTVLPSSYPELQSQLESRSIRPLRNRRIPLRFAATANQPEARKWPDCRCSPAEGIQDCVPPMCVEKDQRIRQGNRQGWHRLLPSDRQVHPGRMQ